MPALSSSRPPSGQLAQHVATGRHASMRRQMFVAITLLSLVVVALTEGLQVANDQTMLRPFSAEHLLPIVLRDLLLVAFLSVTVALVLDRMLLRPLRRVAANAAAFDSTQAPLLSDLEAEAEPMSELQQISQSLNRVHKNLWLQLQEEQQRTAGLKLEIARQQDVLRQTQQALDGKIRELGSMSRLDNLTGLANRREFDEALRREFKRAQRQRGLLALAVLDLDHFKDFNSRYGTEQGDAALVRFAQVMAVRFKRDTDLIARLGGEEFVTLLPGFDLGQAQRQLEQVRDDLLALQIPHEGGSASSSGQRVLTVSVGLAACGPSHPYLSAQALMQAADEALYIAKHAGRDRLSIAASSGAI